MTKIDPGQMSIDVPVAPDAKAEWTARDKNMAYRRAMGVQAYERQWLLQRQSETCTCGMPWRQHAPGCAKHGRR